jgi:hypothetical protein
MIVEFIWNILYCLYGLWIYLVYLVYLVRTFNRNIHNAIKAT